ncbi:MAG: tetratricopeptide repeat protein [Deltaproteobacteria bacterium]|jgi:hypothetical protein|nr:tetratricopeptide repeat protein [Deltaproteobacteria bacterium]
MPVFAISLASLIFSSVPLSLDHFPFEAILRLLTVPAVWTAMALVSAGAMRLVMYAAHLSAGTPPGWKCDRVPAVEPDRWMVPDPETALSGLGVAGLPPETGTAGLPPETGMSGLCPETETHSVDDRGPAPAADGEPHFPESSGPAGACPFLPAGRADRFPSARPLLEVILETQGGEEPVADGDNWKVSADGFSASPGSVAVALAAVSSAPDYVLAPPSGIVFPLPGESGGCGWPGPRLTLDFRLPEWVFQPVGSGIDTMIRRSSALAAAGEFEAAEDGWAWCRKALSASGGPGGAMAAAALGRVARLRMIRHDFAGALEDSRTAMAELEPAWNGLFRSGASRLSESVRSVLPVGTAGVLAGPASGEEWCLADETWSRCMAEIAPEQDGKGIMEACLDRAVAACGSRGLPARRVRGRLAFLALSGGMYGRAAELYGEAADHDREAWGAAHQDTLASGDLLAAARGLAGDAAGSIALRSESAGIREAVLGRLHPETLESRRRTAEAMLVAGDTVGSSLELRRVLMDTETALGAGSMEALTLKAALGAVLLALGGAAGADSLISLAEAYGGLAGLVGPGDRETLAAGVNLSYALRRAGDREGSLSLLEKSAGGLERVLGRDHPESRMAMRQLKVLSKSVRQG